MRVLQLLKVCFEWFSSNTKYTPFISYEDIFIGIDELKQQDPLFYQYLETNNIKLYKEHFPCNKYNGTIYQTFRDLTIAPASYYLNQKNNQDIRLHPDDVRNATNKMNENLQAQWFMVEGNGCVIPYYLRQIIQKMSFITLIGIGIPFTLETLLKDIKKIKGCHVVMINDIPQLFFDCKAEIKKSLIDQAEIQFIIRLRKLVFNTVISKTQHIIDNLPISHDLKERLTMEGMLSQKEILYIGNILSTQFLSSTSHRGRAEENILCGYLALNMEESILNKEWRAKLLKIINKEYFESKEIYTDHFKAFKEEIKKIKSDSHKISPIAFHYSSFCKKKNNLDNNKRMLISDIENPVERSPSYFSAPKLINTDVNLVSQKDIVNGRTLRLN